MRNINDQRNDIVSFVERFKRLATQVEICGSGRMKVKNSPDSSMICLTLSERTIHILKYLLILAIVITTTMVIINLDASNPFRFLRSNVFRSIGLSYTFIFFSWQILSNNFTLITILTKQKPLQDRPTTMRKLRNVCQKNRSFLFILIGYTFSVAFSVMVMIFLLVAHLSGTGVTQVIWNHFGELLIETVLFVIAFAFVVIGYLIAFQGFRKDMIYEKNMEIKG